MSEVALYRDVPTAADEDAVRQLVRATGFFSDEEVEIAAELVRERLEKGLADDGYHFVFLDLGGALAAYACYGRIPGTETSFDLYWIATRPADRGKGLGRALLAEAERRIEQLGGRRVYVETSSRPQYEPTRGFYRACGYEQLALLADFYREGDGKVIYGKRVDQRTV